MNINVIPAGKKNRKEKHHGSQVLAPAGSLAFFSCHWSELAVQIYYRLWLGSVIYHLEVWFDSERCCFPVVHAGLPAILKFQGGIKGGNFERRDERWRICLLNYKTGIDLECFHKCLHNLIRLDLMSRWIRWKSGFCHWGKKLLMPTAAHVSDFKYKGVYQNIESHLSLCLSHQGM